MINITRGKRFSNHFIEDKKDPALDDHALFGKLQGFRAFSITDDIRVVYVKRNKNHFIFLNIGTHAQTYGK